MRSVLIAALFASACMSDEPIADELVDVEQALTAPPAGTRLGVIGDSIALATHSDDMCGNSAELGSCLDNRLGVHDAAWSYASGTQSWSFPRRLGYASGYVRNAAADGAGWSAALAQAKALTADGSVRDVLINLGANDVCAPRGASYVGKLASISTSIDGTLTELTNKLPAGATIYWAGVLDVVSLRNAMATRRHDHTFGSCQALWDLDSDNVTTEAAWSLCKDYLGSDLLCRYTADWGKVRDWLLGLFKSYMSSQYGVDEFACGKVLSSKSTATDRAEAAQFNIDLNNLMAQKAAQYNGRNGVQVKFTNALYTQRVYPYYVSKLDCFHPSRAGQLALGSTLANAFVATPRTDAYFADEFENTDDCTQEFTTWGSCWQRVTPSQSNIRVDYDGDGSLRIQKYTSQQQVGYAQRKVDLSGKSSAWFSFVHRRDKFDSSTDRVDFHVSTDGVAWTRLDYYQGSGNDRGWQAGKYYDLTPYRSSTTWIRFQNNNSDSMRDGDRVNFDKLVMIAW
ncbi:MAG TPA: hypothetical protein VIV11_40450 [Kofleriaceae bacterium]